MEGGAEDESTLFFVTVEQSTNQFGWSSLYSSLLRYYSTTTAPLSEAHPVHSGLVSNLRSLNDPHRCCRPRHVRLDSTLCMLVFLTHSSHLSDIF